MMLVSAAIIPTHKNEVLVEVDDRSIRKLYNSHVHNLF